MIIKSTLLAAGVMLGAVLWATAPAAAATPFFNDWESTDFGSGSSYVVLPAYEGWTAIAGTGIEVQYNGVAGAPLSGENLVELDSFSNTTMERLIDAGAYTLTFFYSPRPGLASASNGIEVLVDGASIFSITGDGAGTTVWTQYSLDFSLLAPGSLRFAAIGTSDGLGGYLEDINLAAAGVPEPASWLMMIGGFAMLGAGLRRSGTRRVNFA